jgi:hypothetical protein
MPPGNCGLAYGLRYIFAINFHFINFALLLIYFIS